MKVIIAGSRSCHNLEDVERAIFNSKFNITEVVSGGAKGADSLGEKWARRNCIPVAKFPAKWDKYGTGAGMIRNREMRDYADALIAVWDGRSSGTANMIHIAQRKGMKVYIEEIK